ncbi:membrane protein insertase YidC [Pararhizobium mangrovi]|uniref:Membrane protein insertase YidC n=1 Tax=Pararhizobium mangrovi TaxID=2590452 RepID=A0A506U8H6_9HYPH|nr:membrane protein insertase YidC [Pararhizobium mangrovi]TPW28177.1 membrane protein insertase YidC [Pararhizobium mangrovi]
MDNNRNYIVAIALSVLVLIGWQYFYVSPRMDSQRTAQNTAGEGKQAATTQAPASQPSGSNAGTAPANGSTDDGAPPPNEASGTLPAGNGDTGKQTTTARSVLIGETPRIAIETPAVIGSLNLKGARLDDLKLKNYHETVDESSPLITLLSPAQSQNGYFAELGYIGNDAVGKVPGPDTVWKESEGGKLTPSNPVTLTWTNDKGVTFNRHIAVDDQYMFTIKDTIANKTGAAISLTPYGRVTRFNRPHDRSSYVLQEGPIGVFGNAGLEETSYSSIKDDGIVDQPSAKNGWLGLTDKYWATTLIPRSGSFDGRYAYFKDGRPHWQTDFKSTPVRVAAGQSASIENLVFAGAKRVPLVNAYRDNLNIKQFDLLIDWGWFYFITKPMFHLMDFFYNLVGNFGVAIILTVIIIKLIFFPLANKSYSSMAKMKAIQPKMQELKEKYGDDRMGMQQEMMKMYKEEKINPIAGCWPMLLQIPVFFALYKVLYTTIEMRHAPFFGWIQDLSAPDPTSIFNLFGLLPFTPPDAFMIGIWPLIMGFTMFMQMRMNPTPPDKTQAMVFTWMPVVFTFMLAHFPAGLVIYYSVNNSLSVLQQSIIMKRQGVKNELWNNLSGLFRRKPKPAE